MLGDDLGRLIESARAESPPTLNRARMSSSGSSSRGAVAGRRGRRRTAEHRRDRRCPAALPQPRGQPRPMAASTAVLRFDRGWERCRPPCGPAAAGEHADEFVEARQAVARSSCGRPGVSAIRAPGRASAVATPACPAAPRRPLPDRPGWRCRPCRRSRRGAPPHRQVRAHRVTRSSTGPLPSAPGGARSARAFSRSSMLQSPWSASYAVSSRRCSQASKASNSAANSGTRDRRRRA